MESLFLIFYILSACQNMGADILLACQNRGADSVRKKLGVNLKLLNKLVMPIEPACFKFRCYFCSGVEL